MKEVISTARNLFLMWQQTENGDRLDPLVEMVFNHVEREYDIGADKDGKHKIGSRVKMDTTRLWMNRDMVESLRDYCDTILEDIEELKCSVDYDPKQSPEQPKQKTSPIVPPPDYSKIDPEYDMKADYLTSRGWSAWYNPDYWVHAGYGTANLDYTLQGMSLREAYCVACDLDRLAKAEAVPEPEPVQAKIEPVAGVEEDFPF